jgi:uncharacterized protein YjbI with pentapeptide repeats
LSEQEKHQQQGVVVINESPMNKGGENRKAQIIGISKYDHDSKFPNLDFCENDANAVYSILNAQGYNIPSNSMLVGRVEWAKMRDEIIKFFTDRTLKQDDTLFFYFSGHGYLDRNTGRTYLSTSEMHPERPESRGIPFDELTTYLNLSNSERIMAVLDFCYSGALEVHSRGKGAEEEYMKAEKGEEIASLANTNMARTVERLIKSGQGKCVLASSLEEQRSFGMEDQPYSLFTYFLIQGLKGANGESVDINGYVTPELLGNYVNEKILELGTIRQKPIRKIDAVVQIILAYYPDLANRQQQQQASQKNYLLQLLKEGKIDEFNQLRRNGNYSRLDFYNVDLSSRDLSYADFGNTDLNLANLREAKLQHAIFVESSLLTAQLTKADLSNANLTGANLLEAKLSNANLSKADLSEAKLSKANLSKADLSKADLSKADLSNAYLLEADLTGAKLLKIKLTGADLSNAYLLEADLTGADLTGADLTGADLSNAYLLEADLTGANLLEADLSNANLTGADLTGADLTGADLTGADLASSIIIGVKFNEGYPECKNANFDSATIIDDEILASHFRNSNGKNVPPAVKDEKELRNKLEERH